MKRTLLVSLVAMSLLTSCAVARLNTYNVAYQSFRLVDQQRERPKDANIGVSFFVSEKGDLTVMVSNLTRDIMVVDQTKSFFVSGGKSLSYYDPTVVVTSSTDFSSSTGGGSVNLGAVAGALGIGGRAGLLMSGINLGGESTDGNSTTTTVTKSDMPQVSIGPLGSVALSKAYHISGAGRNEMAKNSCFSKYPKSISPIKYSVCISYSLDGGRTFKPFVSEFYANSVMCVPVERGRVNNSLRRILIEKPDAMTEPCFILYFKNNVAGGGVYDTAIGQNIFCKYE